MNSHHLLVLLGAEVAQKNDPVAVQFQNILHPRQETSESPELTAWQKLES